MKFNIEWREVVAGNRVVVERRATAWDGRTTGWAIEGIEDAICRMSLAIDEIVLREDVATAIATSIDKLRSRAMRRAEARVRPGRRRATEILDARLRAAMKLDWLRLRTWSGPQLCVKKLRTQTIRIDVPSTRIRRTK